MKKIKRLLSFIFLLFVTLTFAESEIPHQVISENPDKEVTTIESKKLKEKAELDILINKITPIEIEGIITSEGKTVYEILKIDEEKNLLNIAKAEKIDNSTGETEYFITENLSQVLNNRQKQSRGRSKESLPFGIDYEVVENKNTTSLTVNSDKPVYIVKLKDGIMENIFRGNIRETNELPSMTIVQPLVYFEMKVNDSIENSYIRREYDPSADFNNSSLQEATFLRGEGSGSKGEAKIIAPLEEITPITVENSVNLNITFNSKTYIKDLELRNGGGIGYGWNDKVTPVESYNSSETLDALNIVNAIFTSEGNKVALDGKVNKIVGEFLVGKVWYPGIYEYNPNLIIRNIDKENWTRDFIINFPTYIVVSRDSKSYTVKPKYKNMSLINIQDYVFNEFTSEVKNLTNPSSNYLPTDWYYGYDDSNEGIQNEYYGLYLEGDSTNASVERKGKRHLIITDNNSGGKAEIYLEKDEGDNRAKLKYRILKVSSEPDTTVKVKVKYVGHNKTEVEEYTKILYEDLIEITIPTLKEIKEMKLNLDYRLRQLDVYFDAQGNYYDYNHGDVKSKSIENYKELVRLEKEPEGLPQDVSVIAINNYIEMIGGNLAYFRPYGRSEAIIIVAPEYYEGDFVNKGILVYQSQNNQAGDFKTAEIYTTDYDIIKLDVDESNSEGLYGESGSGTLIMNLAKIGDSIVFPMGADAEVKQNEIISNRTKDTVFIPQNFTGIFPNTKGLHENKNIVDNLDIKVNGKEPGMHFVGKVFETPNYKIELVEGSGDLKITKLSDEELDDTIEISYNYGRVKLGDFTLRLVNTPVENVGEVIVKIDGRMKKDVYYYSNGNVSETLNGVKTDYSELIESSLNFDPIDSSYISMVHSIEGREIIHAENEGGYSIFRRDINSEIGESIIPLNKTLNEINSFPISMKNNEEIDYNNNFIVLTNTLITYKGNIKEEITSDTIKNGTAKLEFSNFPIDTVGIWSPGVTGTAISENGSGVELIFSEDGGELFDTRGLEKDGVRRQIVTKLELYNGNSGGLITSAYGEGEEKIVEDLYTRFKIDSDAKLSITKLSDDYEEKNYQLKAYYKDIDLGTFNINIVNRKTIAEPIDIGEVTFELDKRIRNQGGPSEIEWIYADGNVTQNIWNPSKKDYKGLINIAGDFDFQNVPAENSGNYVSDVISIEGRTPDSYTPPIDGIKYLIAKDSTIGDSAFPSGEKVTLNSELKKYLIVSIAGDGSEASRNNRFIIKDNKGNQYTGNIKEVEKGEKAVIAQGYVKFTKENYTATWAPGSTGESDNENINMVMLTIGGIDKKIFDTREQFNNKRSIANKLIILDFNSGAELKRVEGDVGSDLIAELDTSEIFKIDGSGNLTIQGSKEKATRKFRIDAYYNEVLLGILGVEIETEGENSFIIEEDIAYNFGAMVGGEKYNLNGTFLIKNLNNQKIADVNIPTEAVMTHIDDGSKQIPLKIQSSTKVVETTQDIETTITLEATPEKGQTAGEYTGSFDITITIDETTN